MAGRKRIKYDFAGNEEEAILKCKYCKHSYTKINESDTLFCSLKQCRFEEIKTKK